MNQHTIVLPHGRALLQEVPEDTFDFEIRYNELLWLNASGYEDDAGGVELPPANWQLIGVTPLTEEQAGMVVEYSEMAELGIDDHAGGYVDYVKGYWGLNTATESFTSLLTANNIDQSKRWVVLFTNDKN